MKNQNAPEKKKAPGKNTGASSYRCPSGKNTGASYDAVPLDNTGRPGCYHFPPSRMDPFGSYTGYPMDERDEPIQDADDL